MSRLAFATIVIMNAILGLAVYVFGGTQVAPCLAGPAPDIQQRCYENWLATRGVALQLFDTPIPGVAVFLVLTTAAWLLARRRGMRHARGGCQGSTGTGEGFRPAGR